MPVRRRQFLRLASLLPFTEAACGLSIPGAIAAEARSFHGNLPPFFITGIWQQPIEKIALWKARGVNTLFAVNGGGDVTQWTNEANRQGVYMVREPRGIDVSGASFLVADRAAFELDLTEPGLLAFSLMDEPSNLKPEGKDITYEEVLLKPDEIDVIARDWSLGGKALWINHVGNHINNVYLDGIMSDYADSQYIDWLSHDCYPIASGDTLLLELNGYTSTHQGHAIDRISRWSGDKPQFSFVGLTQYNGEVGREPTPAEFRAQAWSSIIHGATGLIYFSFKFSPEFSYDDARPEILREMAVLHAQIDQIHDILMDDAKGGRRPSRLLKSESGWGASGLPFPFEGCEIQTGRGAYKIVLNLLDDTAELTYSPWDLSGVRFDPYQCRLGFVAAEMASE
ncbi:hypothetical protein GOC91_16695 [Sinorhizobium medicae]|uniref:hypothetical protein n=1 Tax=Sinorhizobium medicae TaxID=110321 RepID=UPI000C7C3F84|nr:hypothetical protein [Sinorhizobium medicae]MDX0434145.1 hypothetical protein [Sinorhizobium medicae]MDX0586518.1 hypothetical protein [Sinorhizobium medicae]MDX0612270.1 hypothetical protein [Sinorhizobium medicae]MDX0627848.1 hypothetical protein [Sinorhizobium medicae]MDX0652770.1 hypothetical protein [Sinorhizobium medicae]